MTSLGVLQPHITNAFGHPRLAPQGGSSFSHSLDVTTSLREENRRLHQEAVQRNVEIMSLREELRKMKGNVADIELQRDEREVALQGAHQEVQAMRGQVRDLQMQLATLAHYQQQHSGGIHHGIVHAPTLADCLSTTRYLAHIVESVCRGIEVAPDLRLGNPEDPHSALETIAQRSPDDVLTETSVLLRGMETVIASRWTGDRVERDGCAMQ